MKIRALRLDATDRQTLRHFFIMGRRHKPDFYFAWLTPLASVFLSTLIPYFVGRILAALAHPHASVAHPFIGLVISGVLTIVCNRVAFDHYLRWQPNIMADLQAEAMESLLRRGTSFHNNQVSGKLVSDALDYPNAFLRLVDAIFVNILPFLAVLVVGICIISIQAPLIGLTVLLMSAIAIGSGIAFRHKMAPYRHKRLAATKAVTAHVADSITNIQTVKSFGRETEEMHTHLKLNHTLRDTRVHDWAMLSVNGNNRIIGLFAFELLFILVVVHQVHLHPELLATGIFAFSYTVTLTNRLFDIGSMLRTIEEAFLLAEPMTNMLAEQVEIEDIHSAKDLVVKDSEIELKHLTFHYHDNSSAENVFEDLNLIVRPGEKIGLVGPSGGGKSTLTKLMLRFEDIESGQILIDGQDISQVTQRSLRQSIGYVAQEPLLFHRTIRENIAYGKPAASEAAIEKAAKDAYALDFIKALPSGFDTVVGERGVKLSGGQRQRIAIARAILKDAPILILDEATSALDSESEKVIQQALWRLMEHKTAVVIAHRLSTIQKMDRIVVLDQGKLVEEGTHKELVDKKDGVYARLWAHQSGGFIEE